MLIKESQLRAIIREELLIESIILNENVNNSVKKLLLSESKIKNALTNVLTAGLIMSKVLGIPSGLGKNIEQKPSVEKIAKDMKNVGYGSVYAVEQLEKIRHSLALLKAAAKLVDKQYGKNVSGEQDRVTGYEKVFEEFLESIEPDVKKCEEHRKEIDVLNKKIENTHDEMMKETLENKVESVEKELLLIIDKLYNKINEYSHSKDSKD